MRLRSTRLTAIAHAARRLLGIAAAWSPLSWFSDGEQGAWYDPTDLTRYMSVEGSPEQFPNGNFASSDISAWQLVTGSNAWSSGVFSATGATWLDFATTVGKTYLLSAQLAPTGTYSADLTLWQGGGFSVPLLGDTHTTAARTKVGSFTATAATTRIYVRALAGSGSVNVDNISVREIPLISQATMYQDAAGTTPVTAVEQPVGLILDRRLGALGALGAELNTGTAILYTGNGTVSVAGDVITATCTANGGYGITWSSSVVSGVQVRISLEVVTNSAAKNLLAYANLAHPGISIGSTTGNKSIITFAAVASGSSRQPALILFGGVAGESFSVRVVSIREVPGNHVRQATSTARPTLRNRYNLLTFTEDLTNAVWSKTNCTISANVAEAPSGGTTADRMVAIGAATIYVQQGFAPVVGVTHHRRVALKRDGSGPRYGWIWIGGGNVYAIYDLQDGVVASTSAGVSATIAALEGGWFDCTLVRVAATGDDGIFIGPTTSSVNPLAAATVGDSILVGGASLLLHTDASLPYQRVSTATDYDSDPAKFPLYLAFDGSDDSMATGAIDFSATDEMTVVAGVTKLVNRGTIVELSDDANSNNGCFRLGLGSSVDSDAAAYTSWARGTQTSFANSPNSFASPRKAVVALSSDISVPTNQLRVGGAVSRSDAATQGTGNYAPAQVLRLGSRSASLRLNGRLHQLIIRGKTSADIDRAEEFVAARSGVTL